MGCYAGSWREGAVWGLQLLSRIMSHHGRGSRPCLLCDTAPLPSSALDHSPILSNTERSCLWSEAYLMDSYLSYYAIFEDFCDVMHYIICTSLVIIQITDRSGVCNYMQNNAQALTDLINIKDISETPATNTKTGLRREIAVSWYRLNSHVTRSSHCCT